MSSKLDLCPQCNETDNCKWRQIFRYFQTFFYRYRSESGLGKNYVVFLTFQEATKRLKSHFDAINHFVCLELNADKFQWCN